MATVRTKRAVMIVGPHRSMITYEPKQTFDMLPYAARDRILAAFAHAYTNSDMTRADNIRGYICGSHISFLDTRETEARANRTNRR